MKKIFKSISGVGAAALVLGLFLTNLASAATTLASAATTVVVTPTNTQGWSTADTRPGGAVNFVVDATSPAPNGALQLTTATTTTAKAQYLHAASAPLGQVNDLSYYTKQVSGPPVADPSYQLVTFLNGTSTGFTTLVFEPYQNPTQGPIIPNVWQKWDVSGGLFWSTRTVVCSGGTVVGTPGGPASYTLAQIKAMCPNATVAGFGVNIGSNNPGYNVETDLFNFNGTTYNFQVTNTPSNKDQCKNGAFVNFMDANGQPFKNQGQCVSFVESQKDKHENDSDTEGNGDNQNNNDQAQHGNQDSND